MAGYATPPGSDCARTRGPRRWSATSRTRRPPACPIQPKAPAAGRIVHAPKPVRGAQRVGGTEITHADRELWPGITKQDLAEYWTKVAERALPGIAGRPLALLRCPDGIAGQSFFQKHGNRGMPPAIAGGQCRGPALPGHP